MAKHLCNNCGHVFTHKKGKLRCPSCLRQNSVEAYDDGKKRSSSARDGSSKRLAMFIGVALLVVGGIVGGAVLLHKTKAKPPHKGELRVLDDALLTQTLIARKVSAGHAISPFATSAALEKLVTVKASDGATAKIAAVRDALAKKFASLSVDPSALSSGEVRTAGELASALASKKTERPTRLTGFELATLTAAVLRRAGLLALVAEIYEVKAKTKSADTTGAVGRYVVAIYSTQKDLGKKPLDVLDPARAAQMPVWAGGGRDPKMTTIHAGQLVPLGDASVAARLLALRGLALSKQAPKRNSAEAYELTRLALLAGADSPTLHGARAVVLASAGGLDDAVGEAKQALALRDDAPRRHLIAQLLLAKRQLGEAQAQLAESVKKDEGFWPGHGTLATINWISGQADDGNKHLAAALAIAPEEPQVLALAAARKLQDGDNEAGIALLRKAAARDASEVIQLKLYLALRQAGKNDEATALRAKLEKLAESSPQVKQALAAVDRMAAQKSGTGGGASGARGTSGAAGGSLGAPPARPKQFKLPDMKLGTDPSLGGGAGNRGGLKLPDVKLTP